MFDEVAVRMLAFAAVTLGVLVLGQGLATGQSQDRRRTARRLRELGGVAVPAVSEKSEDSGWYGSPVAKLGTVLASGNGARSADLRTRLALAGYTHPSGVQLYTGIQLVLVATAAAVGLAVATTNHAPWHRVALWAVVGAGAGCMIPPAVLTNRVKARQRFLRNALPDALDIMVLSIEGGASLNAAVTWVTEEIQSVHPVLGAEMATVHREMQLGMTAGAAFQNFADRCGINEARDLAAALVQSERYGASVAKALRAYTDSARRERQLWAEEVAQKASVKIMFPMLLCIFPAMFVVLLGPAAYQLSNLFSR